MTDTSATADRLADPGPPPPPPQLPTGSDRFFSWVRGLGIARADGWLGGVCAGIAARLRIDPIIVRGIVVVAALFGLPMLVIYAISWALLPDITGRIHLREAFQRRFDPALVGIGILFLVGLLPVTPWFVGQFLPFGYLLPAPDVLTPVGVLGTFLAIALVGGLVFVLTRSSRRAANPRSATAPDPRTASADPAVPDGAPPHTTGLLTHAPGTAEAPIDSGDGASADLLTLPAVLPVEPPGPGATASDAEIAQWRETHDAWRVESDAWRRQQQDAERAARERAREERAAAGAAFAAEATERRRIRRATKPRTSLGYVVFVIGAALVIGAISSLWFGATEPGEPAIAVAAGLFAAALVAAVAMIVAGALRRRSGFLAFVTVTMIVAGSITAVIPVMRGIAFGDAYSTSFAPTSFTQLWGQLNVNLFETGEPTEPIVIEKRAGDTYIQVDPGVVAALDVVSPDSVHWTRWDWSTGQTVDEGTWSGRPTDDDRIRVRQRVDTGPGVTDETPTPQVVRLDQQSGTVYVTFYEQ